jgi:hypothetical protein
MGRVSSSDEQVCPYVELLNLTLSFPLNSKVEMSRSTLSSMDTVSAAETFESIYTLLNRLKEDTTAVRDGLKSCNRRIVEVPLGDRLLDPKPHAVAWFKKRKMEMPCDLEEFLEKLFGELGAKRLVCHRTRTILLTEEEAAVFQLQPNFVYKWIEILQRLPTVFY